MLFIKKTFEKNKSNVQKKMIESGTTKKQRKNPNDPGRFIESEATTKEGEKATISYYLDTEKIEIEAQYDGFYAILYGFIG